MASKEYALDKMIVCSISGKKMSEFFTTESEMELNLEMYAPGKYFVKCDGGVSRVIKR